MVSREQDDNQSHQNCNNAYLHLLGTIPPHLPLGPHPLQVVQSAKLLGVTVDDQLTWKLHVTATARLTAYRLHMLCRLKSLGTPNDELKGIYITFILPRLMYASPVWSSSLTSTQLQQLDDVQKRAYRIILGRPAYTNYDHALTTLNLSTLATGHQAALIRLRYPWL
ncbi:hypothetical protein E2C01_060725 [Portunus trituberculatus]|uniref:RNA-directed DNA polymerase from mobile element jockey n=1 Tax=Portunus trituberculatus TaxID=210409 RepID=A0A5B7H9H7_PORTR|nr:hypothetical protein [Portunus trituberculatus]